MTTIATISKGLVWDYSRSPLSRCLSFGQISLSLSLSLFELCQIAHVIFVQLPTSPATPPSKTGPLLLVPANNSPRHRPGEDHQQVRDEDEAEVQEVPGRHVREDPGTQTRDLANGT